jgi:hypothetical protein
MAEEAFALSPIAARPTVPGEADYDAIREAFMETARGRWFLAEYAKRNRAVDTSMVLEAVTRLEANFTAKMQPPALSLAAALGHIRAAVRQAKATAIESMPRADSDETLTSARNGARIIREIAWTLRECGADIRICDLLDTQVKAIETGQQSWNGNGRDEVLASYDVLMQRIEQIADGSAAPVAGGDAAPVAMEQPAAEPRESSVTPLFRSPAGDHVEAVAAESASAESASVENIAVESTLTESVIVAPVEAMSETAQAIAADVVAESVAAEAMAPIVESSAELAAAMADASTAILVEDTTEALDSALDADAQHDLDVLDMVALEMGAADPADAFDPPDADARDTDLPEAEAPYSPAPEMMQQPEVRQPAATAPAADTDLMTLAQIAEAALAPELPQVDPVAVQPDATSSLGAALIAHGVIANPAMPAHDALAPIRKMTQAEKIAFFS